MALPTVVRSSLLKSRLAKKCVTGTALRRDIRCRRHISPALPTRCAWFHEDHMPLEGGNGESDFSLRQRSHHVLHLSHLRDLVSEIVALLRDLSEPLGEGALVAEVFQGRAEDEIPFHGDCDDPLHTGRHDGEVVELSVELFTAEEIQDEPREKIRHSVIDEMAEGCSCVIILQRVEVQGLSCVPTALHDSTAFVDAVLPRDREPEHAYLGDNVLLHWPHRQEAPTARVMSIHSSSMPVRRQQTMGSTYGVAVMARNGGKCFLLARHRDVELLPAFGEVHCDMQASSLDLQYAVYSKETRNQLELLA
eukprot:CAMPEP_0114231322 /NCGR_PEP_ID=MMETSP0058-20121206/3972_1 /TAXON_ID=36894 /ORGANISM="Pyramimonas parkeae, CCMP726" /LENGTH=306 /DNA_ID=CAMNT_0001342643 /DNA_START=365 /DNA_END=1285 /DNA_ORIENTATION=-